MSRGSGLCALCGGPRRGRGARISAPVADCVDCARPVCLRHCVEAPDELGYRCTKCDRARKANRPSP